MNVLQLDNIMDVSKINVDHMQLVTAKPFNEVTKAIELQLGTFDYSVQNELSENRDFPTAKAKFEKMEGSSGLMMFSVLDHGALLENSHKTQKATQYVLGNPLIALQMTQHDIRAALYAPLRILVYENDKKKTCIEYDKPSSLFGQFGNTEVTRVARELDQKLENLLAKAV